MAATRVMMTAAQTTSCFLAKRAFLLPAKTSHGALCFNRRALALKSKRPFSCSAIYNPQVKVSPWHDIPLSLGDGVYNFIVEIPKESKAKMEVATDEASTPIKQDTKKGKLRYYPDIDVVEIGEAQRKIGEVLKIKPLAALAMIDEGELDWKIVAISLDDPKAHLVNDVEKHFPGTLTAIRDWFRDYKIPDGKPANRFGLGEKPANKVRLFFIQISLVVLLHVWY
ncbi:hypothetical protein BRARA_B00320 [Brassica rapa]|uniref:inorganic diphosphatase n=1 Tax=Brassica campestris TaxID=3711 RepID=A0A398A5N4_BRACM|nr:hypothetical protein BRARA_B00320 [Brassica rapa]